MTEVSALCGRGVGDGEMPLGFENGKPKAGV